MCGHVALHVFKKDVTTLQREIVYYRDTYFHNATVMTEHCTL